MALSSRSNVLIVFSAVAIYWLITHQAANKPGVTSNGITRVDPTTGIAFSEKADFFHVAKKLRLLGVGTRKKAIINVYSMGLYASHGLQKEIEKLKGQAICSAILNSKAPRGVELHMNMGIGPEKIAEAVSGITGVDPKVRDKFHDMLLEGMGQGKMKAHEVMTFEWKGVDGVFVTVRGSFIGQVKDQKLARGILELYIGPKSVSPSLRRNLGCE